VKKNLLSVLILVIAVVLHLFFLPLAAGQRNSLPVDQKYAAGLPGPVLKVLALEFDGLMSDFLFLQSLVFVGSTFERRTTPRVADYEWEWMERQLTLSTDLDGRFWDPYYVANAHLGWDARRFEQTNRLLIKACENREWDWVPRFFLGFNLFYFQNDYEQAAYYLMEGARLPDAQGIVKTMASRAAFQGNHTDLAIEFLEEMLKSEIDENFIIVYKARLDGLYAIRDLETAVSLYTRKTGVRPASMQALVNTGLIGEIPLDPFGGVFYLSEDGFVKTTSDLK